MNPIDKAISAFAPQLAVKRAEARMKLSRYDAAYPTRKRKFHGNAKDSGKADTQDSKEKKILRIESSRLLKNNQFAKYAFRDAQSYLAPSGWVPQSGDADLNRKIRDRVDAWMESADITGKRHLLDIFAIGCGMQLIEGDMGIGLIAGDSGIGVQPIRAARIGGPVAAKFIFNDKEKIQENKKSELEEKGLYLNGVETDTSGKVVRYWIYRQQTSKSLLGSNEWVFDKTFEAKNFLLFQDPIDIDEERGITEFAQAVDPLKDHEESMDAMQQKVKAQAKMFGRWKSPYGDLPDNPLEDHCKDQLCEGDDPVKRIQLGDGVEVMGIDEEYNWEPWNDDLPNGSFGPFMETLLSAPAFSLHLPSSWLGLKGKSLQGTDIRADIGKAQTEIERKRGVFNRQVYNPLIKAQLVFWHNKGVFGEVPLKNVLRGRWAYRKDLTVDEGHRSGRLINEAKMGWLNDSDIAQMKGLDEEQMRQGRISQVDDILKDTMDLAKKHDIAPEVVLRLMKDQNLGKVPDLKEEEPLPDNAAPAESD